MKNIQISLVASSIRPRLWLTMFDSLKDNKLNWELIVVGDVKPDYPLADNIKYIYSKVKPAQCYEIGFRQARGELIHWTADEAVYDYEKFDSLDTMYKYYKSFNDYKVITAFTVMEDNGDSFSITSSSHRIGDKTTPRVACFGCISRKFMSELSGYDYRFITGQAENDLCMRALKVGGRIKFCKEALVAVFHPNAHADNQIDSKFRKWYKDSRAFLDKCWFEVPNVVAKKRLIPFEPFENLDILTISQGPKGEW